MLSHVHNRTQKADWVEKKKMKRTGEGKGKRKGEGKGWHEMEESGDS